MFFKYVTIEKVRKEELPAKSFWSIRGVSGEHVIPEVECPICGESCEIRGLTVLDQRPPHRVDIGRYVLDPILFRLIGCDHVAGITEDGERVSFNPRGRMRSVRRASAPVIPYNI